MSDLTTIAAFPLKQTYFCSECDVVMNQVQCPYCLTSNTTPLSTWLNRTVSDSQLCRHGNLDYECDFCFMDEVSLCNNERIHNLEENPINAFPDRQV
jgi:hypothetical protein